MRRISELGMRLSLCATQAVRVCGFGRWRFFVNPVRVLIDGRGGARSAGRTLMLRTHECTENNDLGWA